VSAINHTEKKRIAGVSQSTATLHYIEFYEDTAWALQSLFSVSEARKWYQTRTNKF